MKKTSLSILAVMATLASCAQDLPQSQVPAIVINAFQQQFPKAADVEWEKKGELYEVEFETGLSGTDHKALLDAQGKVLQHEQDIVASELPEAVRKAIEQQFPGYRIDDPEQISANGNVTYKLELKKKPEEWKLVFDATGKILSKLAD